MPNIPLPGLNRLQAFPNPTPTPGQNQDPTWLNPGLKAPALRTGGQIRKPQLKVGRSFLIKGLGIPKGGLNLRHHV